jgi:hypothetical protein
MRYNRLLVQSSIQGSYMLRWLTDVASTVWPLSLILGVLLMFSAYCIRAVDRTRTEEAYKFMRGAAVALLIGFVLLWMFWRRFLIIPPPTFE